MAQGMIAGKVLRPAQLRIADRNTDCRLWWAKNVPETPCFASAEEAQAAFPTGPADVVVLAVKPQHLRDCIGSFRQRFPDAWQESLVVSVAAGIDLAKLTQWLGSQRVARVMPNTPALVGCGASAFCAADGVSPTETDVLEKMLTSFGRAIAVPERLMDAVTGVSGSGPAYVYLFIEAMADGGVAAGLPRQQAMELAAQTVLGAAKMVLQGDDHPGALKDAVASPGGTTIAAIRTLEQNAFRGAVIDAVLASAARSSELRRDADQ